MHVKLLKESQEIKECLRKEAPARVYPSAATNNLSDTKDEMLNDAYSAVRIATALADAFNTDVNSLTLTIVLSWYVQKSVTDLLALLSLGIKWMYLGPTLPAFLTPNVLKYVVDTFDIKPISTPDEDLKASLKLA